MRRRRRRRGRCSRNGLEFGGGWDGMEWNGMVDNKGEWVDGWACEIE